MRVKLLSITVQDQDRALQFYTDKLGFVKKTEIPMGEHRWLTVVSPTEQDGPEVVLEPLAFEPAKVYQAALYQAGIPVAAFQVDDIEAEHRRLADAGVNFTMAPTAMGGATIAVFDDTCGNRIQIFQV